MLNEAMSVKGGQKVRENRPIEGTFVGWITTVGTAGTYKVAAEYMRETLCRCRKQIGEEGFGVRLRAPRKGMDVDIWV